MSEMTPFERQVGEEMRHEMGAPPEFDPLAIARQAATATEADGWSTIIRWLPGGRATRAERGLSMFTAAKLVAATAVVALFGGFLLINVTPMPQGEEVIPGAVTESPVPEVQTDRVFFDVNRHVGPLHDCNETTATEGVAEVTCTFEGTVWASDPRLSGPVRGSLHEFGWEGDGPAISTELHVIENEGGTWRGTRQVVEARETIEWQGKPVLVLSGEGGYAGLTAAIFLRGKVAGVGVILPVPIPEPAEPEDPQPTPAAE